MLLGVDVGGTFTDAVVAAGDRLVTAKAPTTPEDQSEGVLAAVTAALEHGADGGEHALGLVVRGSGRLRGDEPPVDRRHGVGERPADVDPEQHLRARPAHRGRL